MSGAEIRISITAEERCMKIVGSFVIFGSARSPGVALLTKSALDTFYIGLSIARDRARDPEEARRLVLLQTFGEGVETALPAWSEECMVLTAERYVGPYQVEVRGLCAAIALGKPTNNARDLTDGPGKPEGGEKEPRRPVKPRKGGPGGAFFDLDAEREVLKLEERMS